jgi:hypothetical protein
MVKAMSIQKTKKMSDKQSRFLQKQTQVALKTYLDTPLLSDKDEVDSCEFIIFLLLLLYRNYRKKNYKDLKFVKSLAQISRQIEFKNTKFTHLMKNIKICYSGNIYFSADVDQIYTKLYYLKIIYFTKNCAEFEFDIGSTKLADEYVQKFIIGFGLEQISTKEINTISKNFVKFYNR